MLNKTRYFVITSLLVLSVGVGIGVVAYYGGLETSAFSRQGGPDDLKLIPGDTALLAFADVQQIMSSPLRQTLNNIFPGKPDGRQEFIERTGINIDTDIDHIIAAFGADAVGTGGGGHALVLARGRFDAVKIEALIREHGGRVEDYRGKRLLSTEPGRHGDSLSLAFVEPGLIVFGSAPAVRSSVDLTQGGPSVTSNEELMNLVRDLDSGDAWAVGRFDALAARANLPPALGNQLPAIQWFSATANVDAGLRGVVKVESRDEEAANNIREVARGFIALGKLQAAARPELETMMRSIELGGTGKTVALGFDLSPDFFQAIRGLGLERSHRQELPPSTP